MYRVMESLNNFTSETTWPGVTKFHIAILTRFFGRLTFSLNGHIHLNRMSAMTIYIKTLKSSFLKTNKASRPSLGL